MGQRRNMLWATHPTHPSQPAAEEAAQGGVGGVGGATLGGNDLGWASGSYEATGSDALVA